MLTPAPLCGLEHEQGLNLEGLDSYLEGPSKSLKLLRPNKISSMKNTLSLALLMLEVPMGMGMATELHPDVWRGKEKV